MSGALHLAWDLALERPTLGGALVLRQEAELLARARGHEAVVVHVGGPAADTPGVAHLVRQVFGAASQPFEVASGAAPEASWPPTAERQRPGFSYFSYARVVALHGAFGLPPRLSWSAPVLARARAARARFPGRLVALHLRRVAPYAVEESNADGTVWGPFLRGHARPGALDFLLLGDDEPPAGILDVPGVTAARDLALDLAAQMALVSLADAFLGMASGLSTAASFSDVPHVMFKHPAHHPAEMRRELGDGDRFPFNDPRQALWRRPTTPEALARALALVLP